MAKVKKKNADDDDDNYMQAVDYWMFNDQSFCLCNLFYSIYILFYPFTGTT